MAEPKLPRCPSCGATNRVPQEKLDAGLLPRCGRCRTSLSAPAGPIAVTDASFAADVERSPLPVLMDAWAPWCGPCRTVALRRRPAPRAIQPRRAAVPPSIGIATPEM